MMNRDEERQLREIEMSLAREDPRLAERISTFEPWDAHAVAVCAKVITVLGCALALLGLLLGSAFGVFGVLIAVGGFALRLALPATARGRRTRPDDDGEFGTGHDGARI